MYIGLGWPALLGKLNQINTSIFYSPFPKKSRIHVADRFLFKMYSFMYRFSCLIMLVRISPVFPRGSYIVYFSLMHFLASEGSYSLLLAKRVEERKKKREEDRIGIIVTSSYMAPRIEAFYSMWGWQFNMLNFCFGFRFPIEVEA